MVRKIPKEAIEIIKKFEGFSSIPYYCPSKFLTLGWGHLIKENEKEKFLGGITKEEGEEFLKEDLIKTVLSVCRLITVCLEDNQYAAIISFVFNLGGGALQRSTLRQKINREEHDDVPNEFRKWIFAGGRKLKGLVRRRETEAVLYATGGLMLC